MRRRLFTILSAVSLLLCVATAVLWVLSYRDDPKHPQTCGIRVRDDLAYFIASHHGRIFMVAQWITPAIRDRATGRIFIAGYGTVVVELPNGDHASEHECYPSFFRQSPTKIPFCTTASDEMFVGRGGPPPNMVRAYIKEIAIPYWSVGGLLALPGISVLSLHLLTQKRRSKGVCSCCGYDLRATPERCPECGTVNPSRSSHSHRPTTV